MNNYKKVIILSSILLVIIALITVFMTLDIDLLFAKSLSISGIQSKKQTVQDYIAEKDKQEKNYIQAKSSLENAKNEYDTAKTNFEMIGEDKKKRVMEATKEEKYFIEYLWIVLGNYAKMNNISISIITPGSTEKVVEESVTDEEKSDKAPTPNANTPELKPDVSQSTPNIQENTEDKVKIVVEGRYSNIADFVFDVENDKELRFKLDNIKMKYSGDNKVNATFDVLRMMVSK